MEIHKKSGRWHVANWGRNVVFEPSRVVEARSIGEVVAWVDHARKHDQTLRVVGAGHSWSPLIETSGVLMSLDRLDRVLSIDRVRGEVSVEAGIRLNRLIQVLDRHGLALANLGSVTQQSIAGATATGTHGSGLELGSLSTLIRRVKLVTGRSEVVEFGPDDPEFSAACLSLGALGVVVEVTLSVEPRYMLVERSFALPFDVCLASIDALTTTYPRMKIWWLPHTGQVQVFTYERVDAIDRTRRLTTAADAVLNTIGFAGLLRLGAAAPGLVPALNTLVGKTYFKDGARRAPWDRALSLAMPPRHREAEFGVAVERCAELMVEVRDLIVRDDLKVGFINEVRFVAADSLWLSNSLERDSCQFGAYTSNNSDADAFLRGVERIAQKMDGRPHWGKEFSSEYDYLARVNPRLDDFERLRARLDPDGVFLNEFLKRILQRTD